MTIPNRDSHSLSPVERNSCLPANYIRPVSHTNVTPRRAAQQQPRYPLRRMKTSKP
jgi:hypothetical protein